MLHNRKFVRKDSWQPVAGIVRVISLCNYIADFLDGSEEEHSNVFVERLQDSGEAFVSHAIVRDTFLLRACIVNFRTTLDDIAALPDLVARLGAAADRELRLTGAASTV